MSVAVGIVKTMQRADRQHGRLVALEEAARLLPLSASEMERLIADGSLPSITDRDGQKLVALAIAEKHALRSSLRPLLLLRAEELPELPRGRTLKVRLRQFRERAHLTPEEYLAAWHDGSLDASLHLAELAVEAEDLLAAVREAQRS